MINRHAKQPKRLRTALEAAVTARVDAPAAICGSATRMCSDGF